MAARAVDTTARTAETPELAKLLTLPTELLDRIFRYLDSDRSVHISPLTARADLCNISLTSRRLRAAASPTLFRNVKLNLQWADGALIEPGLCRLRAHSPDLAKYIRCVHIEAHYGHYDGHAGSFMELALPDEGDETLKQIAGFAASGDGEIIQKRFSGILKEIADDTGDADLPPDTSRKPMEVLRAVLEQTDRPQRRSFDNRGKNRFKLGTEACRDLPMHQRSRDEEKVSSTPAVVRESGSTGHGARLRFDALLVVMLCFPQSLNGLVFEALPELRMDTLQHVFAFHIAAFAMRIFHDRLKQLSMITSGALPYEPSIGRPLSPWSTSDAAKVSQIVTEDIIGQLSALKRLVVASQIGSEYRAGWQIIKSVDLERYRRVSHNITDFELWNTRVEPLNLTQLLRGFPALKTLALKSVMLHTTRVRRGVDGRSHSSATWLMTLIDFRRFMPTVRLHIRDLSCAWVDGTLPPSCIRWLLQEAVPALPEGAAVPTLHPGIVPASAAVTYEREQRLAEDFVTFFPLWIAEDGEAGGLAAEHRRKEGAKLADDAMTSRSRTYENIRRDRVVA